MYTGGNKSVGLGGVLSLRHIEVEAQLNTKGGLHHWDLFMDDGDFIIANNDNYMNISKLLSPFCNVKVYEEKSIEYNEYMVVVNMEKKRELSEEILCQYDADLGNGILFEALFETYLR